MERRGAVVAKRVQRGDYRKLIPVNTGGEGGSEDFGLSQGFQRERRGSSCGQKSTKGGPRKTDSRQYGGGGKGVIEYYRALWKDQVSFKLRKHLIQGSGGGSEDFGLSHSFHGERKGITFWQKNTKGS